MDAGQGRGHAQLTGGLHRPGTSPIDAHRKTWSRPSTGDRAGWRRGAGGYRQCGAMDLHSALTLLDAERETSPLSTGVADIDSFAGLRPGALWLITGPPRVASPWAGRPEIADR